MAASFKGAGKTSHSSADSDKDRWIHRDKLTQIEIQEYRDLGLEPPAELLRRAAESKARAASREQAEALRSIRSPSPYRYDENEEFSHDPEPETEQEDEEQYHHQHHQHQQETGEDYDDDNASVFVPVDPRSPEEIAADPYEDGRTSPNLRKSNSKIPLAPYSPLPVPQEHLDRGQPLPRKRGASAGYEDGSSPGLAYPKTRVRKDSVGSGPLLDDEPLASSPITGPLTPLSGNAQPFQERSGSISKIAAPVSKKKTAGAATTTTTAQQRNASATRQRTPSQTPSRPGTSSGERPRTANRTEGDPPWLATMWKTDPRLPPDQQMIPTHARRIMQEQLEREGKAGQLYDRDLNVYTAFEDGGEDGQAQADKAHAQAGEEIERVASPTTGDRSARWPLSDASLADDAAVKALREGTPSPTKLAGGGGSSNSINGSPGKKGSAYAPSRLTDSPKPSIGLFPSPRIGSSPDHQNEIVRTQSPKPLPPNPPQQLQQQQSPHSPQSPLNRQMSSQSQSQSKMQQQQQQPGQQPAMGLETRVTGGLEEEEKDKKRGGCGCCVVM